MGYLILFRCFVLIPVFCLFYIINKEGKAKNKEYSVIDTILLFSGIPMYFGYLIYLFTAEHNQSKIVSDMLDEAGVMPALGWTVFVTVLYIWRNRKYLK